jgi:hypothetical protein
MESHWIRRHTYGAFVVARGLWLNIGKAVSCFSGVGLLQMNPYWEVFVGFLPPIVCWGRDVLLQ